MADLAGSERADFTDDEHGAVKAQIMRAYINLVLEDMMPNLTMALVVDGTGGGKGEAGGKDSGLDRDDRRDGGGGSATGEALGGIQSWIKYGNFAIFGDHFSRISQLYATPPAPWDLLYPVPILVGC